MSLAIFFNLPCLISLTNCFSPESFLFSYSRHFSFQPPYHPMEFMFTSSVEDVLNNMVDERCNGFLSNPAAQQQQQQQEQLHQLYPQQQQQSEQIQGVSPMHRLTHTSGSGSGSFRLNSHASPYAADDTTKAEATAITTSRFISEKTASYPSGAVDDVVLQSLDTTLISIANVEKFRADRGMPLVLARRSSWPRRRVSLRDDLTGLDQYGLDQDDQDGLGGKGFSPEAILIRLGIRRPSVGGSSCSTTTRSSSVSSQSSFSLAAAAYRANNHSGDHPHSLRSQSQSQSRLRPRWHSRLGSRSSSFSGSLGTRSRDLESGIDRHGAPIELKLPRLRRKSGSKRSGDKDGKDGSGCRKSMAALLRQKAGAANGGAKKKSGLLEGLRRSSWPRRRSSTQFGATTELKEILVDFKSYAASKINKRASLDDLDKF
jgi:hypothetical protein